MAAKSPLKEPPTPVPGPSSDTQLKFSSPNPTTPPVKPEISPTTAANSTPAATLRPSLLHPSPDAGVVHVPSYSRWFSWENIDECEIRFLPEFFDSRSPSKNPRVYKYYRNSIIKQFRENPARKITFTEVRKTLVGDVLSVRRVFDFLEMWGLINYSTSPATRPLSWEDSKEGKSSGDGASLESSAHAHAQAQPKETVRKLCSGCKSVCSIACFACDKYDLTLCARCYVRGNYRVGVSNADFRRVEISEEIKTDWTEKDTLQLLEAIMHNGDDWKRVAQHVGGRSEKDCITHFIKLPFGEEFVGYPDSNDAEYGSESNKRMRLTPLADASNPIMAQAAFLSAIAGEGIAEAAARAAVATLFEEENRGSKWNDRSLCRNAKQDVDAASNGETNQDTLEKANEDANAVIEKEEQDMEREISGIIQVQMKEIQDKILRFEAFDLQMEKEWHQIERMKSLLFADQLNLLFHKSAVLRTKDRIEENGKTDVAQ
ncbi:hypothetical protein SLE2022_175010 [Rubroshorea leprosula]